MKEELSQELVRNEERLFINIYSVNQRKMHISVVIPTCNRRQRLLLLLQNLDRSTYPLLEVIIIDSGEDILEPTDYSFFKNLAIFYLKSERSVCIQRNIGIKKARGEWIFLCDDDIEVPADYLQKIADHIKLHHEAGAVSGLVLQKENNEWKSSYPVHSALQLSWKFIFQQSIWGEIRCKRKNILVKKMEQFYQRKGNHISKAVWPVITDFSGNYFVCPVYGLGASVVKKEWLMQSLYAEVLDKHGIGDNYGVSVNFPGNIHVLSGAVVYHHQEQINRLHRPLQYFRRVLALDYFVKTNRKLRFVRKTWLIWSLTGNLLEFIFVRDRMMIKPVLKAIWKIASGNNPYYRAAKEKKKVIEPVL
jgi:glycosyltransferase involved in cell wall biosynthesis